MPKCRAIACAVGLWCAAGAWTFAGVAQTRPADITWNAAAGDRDIRIPAGDKPSIILFYRPRQQLSANALKQLSSAADKKAQTLIVVSGPYPADIAQPPFPVVLDRDYAISGKMNVHAWPTTVLVNASGDKLAHLAGLGVSYAQDVSAYSAFFAGEISEAKLNQRLSDRQTVMDSASQAAARHLQIAQKLISRDRIEDAQSEIENGLKLQADSGALKLELVRVLVIKNELEKAQKILESVPQGSVPSTQMSLARARLLAASGKMEEAIAQFQQAVRLNPNASQTYYEMGLVQQKLGQHQAAAQSFRKAFELSR